MRQFKFRAWNKSTKRMTDNLNDWNVSWLNDTGYNIMQYTGLKDKNGKEIYEGDIVKVPTGKAKIVYSYGTFMWIDIKNSLFAAAFSNVNSFRPEEMEVVGNIYENPDLITKF